MSEFEQLVRPFESEVTPSRPVYTPGQKRPLPITVSIGRAGSGNEKTISSSISMSMTFYCERHENEKKSSS